MNPHDRVLAVLAASFAPGRAAALVGRRASPDAPELTALATRLAASSRGERLAALRTELALEPSPPPGATSAADQERPLVAEALRRGAPPRAGGRGSPPAQRVLARLVVERLAT